MGVHRGPLRAIADIVYVRKDVSWKKDGARFLLESLRIEEEDLAALAMDDFDEVHDSCRSSRVRAYLKGLRKERPQ